MARTDRDTRVAGGVAVLLLIALAIDHLVGTEREEGESGLADPGAFVLSVAVAGVVMAILFLFVVRRTDDPREAAKRGVLCSALAVPAIVLAFLGLPYPLAGAGIALGLRGRSGARATLASTAVVLGVVVVVALTIGYVSALFV